MADPNHRIAIVVAVIGVTGTLGAALLANWDKVFGRAPPATPAPAAAAPAAATPTVSASLTGRWRDSTGPNDTSRINHVGSGFQFSRQGMLPNGTTFSATGNGTVDGQQVVSHYEARYNTGAVSSGSCSGSISADATRISLQCTDSLLGPFASIAVRE